MTLIGPTALARPKNFGNDGKGINGFSRQHLRGLWAWEISQDDDANDLVNAMSSR